jgi:hypothetical protein|tara:strand:- start:914 stop:1090 length:177 start_codon:yes stop_codon:yes gene_type:complete
MKDVINAVKKGDWVEVDGERGNVIGIVMNGLVPETFSLYDGREGWDVEVNEIEEIEIL